MFNRQTRLVTLIFLVIVVAVQTTEAMTTSKSGAVVYLPIIMSNTYTNVDKSILSKPSTMLTNNDLEIFVDLVFNEQVNVEETKHFLDNLSPEQLDTLRIIFDSNLPTLVDQPDAIEIANSNQKILLQRQQAHNPNATNGCDPGAFGNYGFCWQQDIEYFTPYANYAEDKAPSWYQLYTTICDNDPNDIDLVLYFDVNSNDPNKLVWSTSSAKIYTAASTENNKKLNGWDFDNYGAHLCISTRIRASMLNNDAAISQNIRMQRFP